MMTNVMDKEPAAYMIFVKELHDHQRVETIILFRKVICAILNLNFVTINVMGPEHALIGVGVKANQDDLYPKISVDYLLNLF